jgi:photosystem II stability/assembly factor-like uncharacterized protein
MKKKLFITTLFALLATISVNAQWYQQDAYTLGNLNSIHCINDSTCYAVGYKSNIRKTTNGGATNWTAPTGSVGTSDKLVVKMLNKDTILIGQDNFTFRKTVNGSTGSNWSLDIPISPGGSNGMRCNDIAFISTTNLIAVGGSSSGRLTSTSTNSGTTWTQTGTGSGAAAIFGMHTVNSNTIIACGALGTFYRTIDAGNTWTVTLTSTVTPTPNFYDINFPTPSVGYVVGGSATTVTATTGGVVYKTTNGGISWSIPSNTGLLPNTLYGVHFVNKDTGYVVGNGGKIQVTKNGGATWSAQISPVTSTLNKIFFSGKNVGYIAGDEGVILKTSNGGFIPTLLVNAGNDISVCKGFSATIGGSTIASGGTKPYAYSWSPVTNTNSSLVVIPTANTTYTVTVTDANGVSASDFVKVSKYAIPTVSFSGLPSICCLNGPTIPLVGTPTGGVFTGLGITGNSFDPKLSGSGKDSVYYTYTDIYGCIKTSSTWSISITSAPAKNSLCLVTVDSSTSTKNIITWEKPSSLSIDSFRLYRKNSSGVWSSLKTVDYTAIAKYVDGPSGIDPTTNSNDYAVSVIDTCGLESVLSDSNSTILLQPPVYDELLNQFILYWSDYAGFAFANYEIWRKNDANTKWKKIGTAPYIGPNQYIDTTPTFNALYRIQVTHPMGCMIDSNTTLHSTMSNTSQNFNGVSKISITNLLSIFPNPNNGVFTFQIAGMKYQTAHARLYDMFGKLVFESEFKNQKYPAISIQGVSSGIYQLQVITDKGIANKTITIQ